MPAWAEVMPRAATAKRRGFTLSGSAATPATSTRSSTGNLIVERSRDPECDAARALLAQGLTGKLRLCDGKTGVPRTIIDIEAASHQRVSEESRDGLRIGQCNPDSSLPRPEDASKDSEAA